MKDRLILVIDDDADFRTLIRRFLEAAGFKVIEAADVASGLKAAEAAVPHLMITDLMMAGENGFVFLDKRRKHPELNRIPTLVVSAAGHKDLVFHAMSLGANDYIVKPIQAEAVVRRVRKALKDEAFGRLEFPDGFTPKVKVWLKGRMSRAGETGFELDAPVRIGREARLEVKGEWVERLDFSRYLLKTGMMDGMLGSKGYYLNQVVAIGVSEETAQTVRKIVRFWK